MQVRAMQYLARREHSRAELRAKLLRGAESAEEDGLDVVLDQLAERGWLSDQRAAEQTVQIKRTRFGTQRIVHELRQKGIPEGIISGALPELKEGELAVAREVWRKKFGEIPRDAKEKARQVRFLQSRGFSLDVIFSLLRLTDGADCS